MASKPKQSHRGDDSVSSRYVWLLLSFGSHRRICSSYVQRQTQGNQGVRDAVQALQFIHDNIAAFGGDPNSVTLAGQSSGAHLIRAILNAPAAAPLFQRAILHSDPANFGTQTQTTSRAVSDFALSQTGCSDLGCLRSATSGDLLSASTTTVQAGQGIDDSLAASEVWRPFIGSLTGSPFEDDPSGTSSTGKPIIFTNVENEGGSVVGSMLMPTSAGAQSAQLRAYPVTLPRDQLFGQMFNGGRAAALATASQYSMDTPASSSTTAQAVSFSETNDGLRQNIERSSRKACSPAPPGTTLNATPPKPPPT